MANIRAKKNEETNKMVVNESDVHFEETLIETDILHCKLQPGVVTKPLDGANSTSDCPQMLMRRAIGM